MKQQILQYLSGGAVWWVIAAFLRAMPPPKADASTGYVWLHNFAAIIGANFDKLGGSTPEEK